MWCGDAVKGRAGEVVLEAGCVMRAPLRQFVSLRQLCHTAYGSSANLLLGFRARFMYIDLEEQPSASAVFPSSHASLPATHFPSHCGDALAEARLSADLWTGVCMCLYAYVYV
jgi:hypothetical protein